MAARRKVYPLGVRPHAEDADGKDVLESHAERGLEREHVSYNLKLWIERAGGGLATGRGRASGVPFRGLESNPG
jgi:hypothetical protein